MSEKSSSRLIHILKHVACVSAFIGYELLISYSWGNKMRPINYIPYYVYDISLFYIIGELIFIRIERIGSSHLLTAMLLIIATGVHIGLYLISSVIIEAIITGEDLKFEISKVACVKSLWRAVYFIMLAFAYWLAFRGIRRAKQARALEIIKLQDDKEKLALEKEKLVLENASLRSQINPHLILNALNLLHNTYRGLSSEADEIVLLLSDLMQDSLSGVDENGMVSLSQELDNVERCIKLNQLTSPKPLNLLKHINYSTEQGDLRIPPIVLVTIVENMFKHGEMFSVDKPARLEINVVSNQLLFQAENFKKPARSTFSNGIGLQNTMTRLKNYYPHKHTMEFINSDNNYITTLKINL